MKTIAVEPEQLEAAAARIDERDEDYIRSFTQLFSSVDSLKGSWIGKDNVSFTNQISKFESDFREMSVLCSKYAEFLRSSAKSYRQMQDDLASQASALAQ